MLSPTPKAQLVDAAGRPYFLWDLDLTLDELRARLRDSDSDLRHYFLAKVLRQAKPDDALQLVSAAQIATAWPRLEAQLGREREFWRWLLERWGFDVTRADR